VCVHWELKESKRIFFFFGEKGRFALNELFELNVEFFFLSNVFYGSSHSLGQGSVIENPCNTFPKFRFGGFSHLTCSDDNNR